MPEPVRGGKTETDYNPFKTTGMTQTPVSKRLESLDILRGFDLFCLVALEPVLRALRKAIDAPWYDALMTQFSHVAWEGFSCWDIVMPLFMFMAGVSIPFAMAKYLGGGESHGHIYLRIAKRFVVLWVLGMVVQGNLLALDPGTIRLFSNTLQAIAVGYVIAALFFLNFKPRTQVLIAAGMLLLYWALMTFVSVNGYGGGNFTPDGNLAEYIDRVVLGRFRDRATLGPGGEVVFAESYRYTWILSSVNFGVTVMTGVFAGMILRSTERSAQRKTLLLLGWGAAMAAAGWLWGLQMPVIKKIWTSSMVLVSSGYCFLLMGLFYYLVDCRGIHRGLSWLKVYGMNSIAAYVLGMSVSFASVSRSLFFGFEPYIGSWYGGLIAASNVTILFLILLLMYRRGVFLKA